MSVLFFDTPTLTSTDPPAVSLERALSAMPEDKRTPDALSAPSAAIEPVRNLLEHTGAGDLAPAEGIAQAQP